MPVAAANSEKEQVAEPAADHGLQRGALDLQEADVVLDVPVAEQRRVREHRGERDGEHRDRDEGGGLLDVGELPPTLPAGHVRVVGVEHVTVGSRVRLGLTGDR
jgi:hypothetical protein